jgi:hypothetical protein
LTVTHELTEVFIVVRDEEGIKLYGKKGGGWRGGVGIHITDEQ